MLLLRRLYNVLDKLADQILYYDTRPLSAVSIQERTCQLNLSPSFLIIGPSGPVSNDETKNDYLPFTGFYLVI